MTARYRCPWCGSFSSDKAKEIRLHEVIMHREKVQDALHGIEDWGKEK